MENAIGPDVDFLLSDNRKHNIDNNLERLTGTDAVYMFYSVVTASIRNWEYAKQ